MKETNPLRHSKLRASVENAYKGVSDLRRLSDEPLSRSMDSAELRSMVSGNESVLGKIEPIIGEKTNDKLSDNQSRLTIDSLTHLAGGKGIQQPKLSRNKLMRIFQGLP
jgi:hypothetical protein